MEKELICELYISPSKEANEEKYGHNQNQCICCAKPIKDISNSYWIHMNEGGDVLNNSINESTCEELTGYRTMGCFPVGNECAKRFKKDFKFKYSNEYLKK